MGNKISERLTALSMSQGKLAKKLGVVRGTISNWVQGTRLPDRELLPRLATALGVSTDWLLGVGERVDDASMMEPATRADIARLEGKIERMMEMMEGGK